MATVNQLTNNDFNKASDTLVSFFKQQGASLSSDQERLVDRALDVVFDTITCGPVPTEYSLL